MRVIDAHTKQATEYFARIIFVNASCLNTNLILLNSTCATFPNGLGNDNDLLGRYLAFQNYRGVLTADIEGPADKYYFGRRPLMLIPSFRNLRKQEMDFQRGYIGFWGAGRKPRRGHSLLGRTTKPPIPRQDWSFICRCRGK